jgi:hypothetical protein
MTLPAQRSIYPAVREAVRPARRPAIDGGQSVRRQLTLFKE